MDTSKLTRDQRTNLSADLTATPSVLSQMVDDPYWLVQRNIAGHPNTPREDLARLAVIGASTVQRTVASNSNTPRRTLDALARHSDPSVRNEVALNPGAPAATIARLTEDNSIQVRENARSLLT